MNYRQSIPLRLIALFLFLPPPREAHSWGFFAHKRINEMAVFTMPPSLIGFYKQHLTYLVSHATDADKRRYADPEESCRHFFDSEFYVTQSFDSIPRRWTDALNRYGKDSLRAHGIVPWYIERMVHRLEKAFREENQALILHYSADLGHYVADAHVPLHTTRNYNGQLTNQTGIHAFWESRIPELNAESYDYFAGRATYIENVSKAVWSAVVASYQVVDSVLCLEADLTQRFAPGLKYSYETRGTVLQRVYSESYTEAYNKSLGDMVERRMIQSIRLTGCLWFTAWVNAGQPDLSKLDATQAVDSL
jgi:hypothetical protein